MAEKSKDMVANWVYLAALEDIPVGEARGFDPFDTGRDTMFVVREDTQTVLAYRNACPHIQGARMAWKKDHFMSGDGRHIACFAHGALFRISDGLCISGPCPGEKLNGVGLKTINQNVYFLRKDLLT